jgi:glyoxylase-like metal-dependent hydrolase (beta-lactamase superfamily II)
VPLSIQTITVGPLAVNCYLVGDSDSREAIIIDPGAEPERILAAVSSGGWTVNCVIVTHAHFDHVLAAEAVLETTGAPFLMHPMEVILLERVPDVALRWLGVNTDPPPHPERLVTEGDTIRAGDYSFTVAETPGHSPGGICLVGEEEVFVGDTVFEGSIGRTDLPGANLETLITSIREKLLPLDGGTVLYPGHGPPTTIDREKKTNPFFLQYFG